MNSAHLHLILVHLPIVGIPIAALALAAGMRMKNSGLLSSAHLLIVGSALAAAGAFLSGGAAEELVEHIKGVSEHAIEEHEELAEATIWVVALVGLAALGSLLAHLKQYGSLFNYGTRAVLVGCIASSVLLAMTAYEGGKIRHPEAYDKQVAESPAARGDDDE